MMRHFGMPSAPEPGAFDPMAEFFAATQQVAEYAAGILEAGHGVLVGAFRRGICGAQAPAEAADSDRRFAAEAWRNDPRFDLIRRSYLAYSTFLRNTVESAQLDEKTKAQMRHGMGQFIDAMSPSNFLVTNPEALQHAAETGGKSLTEGMNLFFEDMAKGRVSSTDEKAYEVGKNIATTPGAVIFENDLIQLIQYAPTTDRVYERPLLIGAAGHQQVLHPRPAARKLVRPLRARPGPYGVPDLVAEHRREPRALVMGRLPRARHHAGNRRSVATSRVRIR